VLGLRVIEPLRTAPGGPRGVWSVAGLVHAVADALASRFSACTVQGEVSGWSRAASGHCYFSLRDADTGEAMLRCALFRRAAGMLDFVPRDGQLVTVRGRMAVYEPRGELQFVAEAMQVAGAGALYERFLRLKARLEAEGLFDTAHKRALPRFPQRIGVVTSLGAAALHDVLTALARRAPQVEVIVYPSLVQGPDAPLALVSALATAAARQEVDLLLLCRGGGSLEDLWAFNDERVVRAVAASPLVIVCGVGHETDVSLCDFAADLRAPTPTAAAELAAPSAADCLERRGGLAGLLQRRSHQLLDLQAQRLDRAAQRLARPSELMHRQQRALDGLAARLRSGCERNLQARGLRLPPLAARLQQAGRADLARRDRQLVRLSAALSGLDPARVLRRGYAWLSDTQGRPATSVGALRIGDHMNAVLADGQAQVQVESILPAGQAAPARPPKP
jgi:exodeoxyribonuclease VII large subunit